MERKHSEEILMKESAFSRTIDSLQSKFEECKAGLSRLSEERDEANTQVADHPYHHYHYHYHTHICTHTQVAELNASLGTMSSSFNRVTVTTIIISINSITTIIITIITTITDTGGCCEPLQNSAMITVTITITTTTIRRQLQMHGIAPLSGIWRRISASYRSTTYVLNATQLQHRK
jgi:hypothetical protein